MIPHRWTRKRRRAFALGQTLLLVLLLSVLAGGLMQLSTNLARISNGRELRIQALNVAQIGIEDARSGFAFNPDYFANGASRELSFNQAQAGSGGTTRCKVVMTRGDVPGKDVDGNAVNIIQVTSVGTVYPGNRPPVSKELRISLGPQQGSNGILDYTIVSRKDLTITGDENVSSITSFGKIPHMGKTPDASVLTSQGSIHSNGKIVLSGSALVGGQASAVGTIEGASGRLVGKATQHADPVWFPPITQSMRDKATSDGVTAAATDLTLSSGALKGKYEIPAGKTLYITGSVLMLDGHTVWVTGNLVLSGLIYGAGSVIVDGMITVDRTKASRMAGNVLLMTPTTAYPAISYLGPHIYRGMLYAPNGAVKFSAGPNLAASIVADSVELGSHGGIYSDISSGYPPNDLPKIYEPWAWEELFPKPASK